MAEERAHVPQEPEHNGSLLIPDIKPLSEEDKAALHRLSTKWAQSVPPIDPDEQGRANPFSTETVRGAAPGTMHVRVRPSPNFVPLAPGKIQATDRASLPQTGVAAILSTLKRAVVGDPLAVSAFSHERLTKLKALAVLSSDAISSVAYATEQILVVLLAAGTASFGASLPIAAAIVSLMVIVGLSYRQTIRAYPKGGGSYIVAKDNLGALPGLTAGAALMTDYTLTVAVSVAGGIAAIISAYPSLEPYRVTMGVACIILIALGNLRGIREAGTLFAVPTYLFIFGMYVMIGKGFWDLFTGNAHMSTLPPVVATESVGIFLILRAFSNGCSAMTGVEAISDGVPAFEAPQWKNARTTLTWMIAVLGSIFAGITILTHAYQVQPDPSGAETVISRLARLIVGNDSLLYFYLQFTTFLILVLAANTAFSDFPRLLYFMARDSYAPRLFRRFGGRLALSNGIITLTALAAVLYIAFGGLTDRLIPLYTIGVFTSFTLSQFGMVVRWRKFKESGWRTAMILNGVGAVTTLLVLMIAGVEVSRRSVVCHRVDPLLHRGVSGDS